MIQSLGLTCCKGCNCWFNRYVLSLYLTQPYLKCKDTGSGLFGYRREKDSSGKI